MKQGVVLKYEFVEFISGELKEGTIYVVDAVWNRVSPLCLRLRKQGRHTAAAHGLEAYFRRQDHFAPSFHRELEFPVPISLLDQEQQGAMGGAVVPKRNRRWQGS